MATIPNTMTSVTAPRIALPLANNALMNARPEMGMHFPLIWAARVFRYSRIVMCAVAPVLRRYSSSATGVQD